ncbi:hypothetical protein LUW76_40760 [Actinomadura madurae]|uniref:hypothetical protein n=1 Tax=Actinomadura madurae TaxID=1993 RepID=UPI0020276A94|nr:hypothetical protein [Actinomadura madurae]URN00140.1 hypothetical protein LUW76_40760 [Actinomadura madurae]
MPVEADAPGRVLVEPVHLPAGRDGDAQPPVLDDARRPGSPGQRGGRFVRGPRGGRPGRREDGSGDRHPGEHAEQDGMAHHNSPAAARHDHLRQG